jgi:hypothetical protein
VVPDLPTLPLTIMIMSKDDMISDEMCLLEEKALDGV